MATITMPGMLLTGDHASRPAATAVGGGTLYACSTHALIYQSDGATWSTWATLDASGGIPATIFDAQGDIIIASAADTAARLAKGATGTVLTAGASTVSYVFPPGTELDYAEATGNVTISATAEATATTLVTGNAVAYDGSTIVEITFYCPGLGPGVTANHDVRVYLYDGASSIGWIGYVQMGAAGTETAYRPITASRRLTPSAATHTYSIRASRTGSDGTMQAGAGGSGNFMPASIRITRV